MNKKEQKKLADNLVRSEMEKQQTKILEAFWEHTRADEVLKRQVKRGVIV